MLKLAVTGACGRMGERIISLACESDAFEVLGALESAGHPRLGLKVGGSMAQSGAKFQGPTMGSAKARPSSIVIGAIKMSRSVIGPDAPRLCASRQHHEVPPLSCGLRLLTPAQGPPN